MSEVFTDWKFYAFIFQTTITVIGFMIIKFNDFSHLEKDVREIKADQKQSKSDIGQLKLDVAVLKQRLDDTL